MSLSTLADSYISDSGEVNCSLILDRYSVQRHPVASLAQFRPVLAAGGRSAHLPEPRVALEAELKLLLNCFTTQGTSDTPRFQWILLVLLFYMISFLFNNFQVN